MKTLIRNIIAARFQSLVVQLIRRNDLKVVAIAGSVGKTSTKRAVASVLSEKFRVLAHDGNYNSQLGVPLSVFELEAPANILNVFAWTKLLWQAHRRLSSDYPYQLLVLELSTDHPG